MVASAHLRVHLHRPSLNYSFVAAPPACGTSLSLLLRLSKGAVKIRRLLHVGFISFSFFTAEGKSRPIFQLSALGGRGAFFLPVFFLPLSLMPPCAGILRSFFSAEKRLLP